MNTQTGEIYMGTAEIEAARERGETVVPVSEHVAHTMRAGQAATAHAATVTPKPPMPNRKQRRSDWKNQNRKIKEDGRIERAAREARERTEARAKKKQGTPTVRPAAQFSRPAAR